MMNTEKQGLTKREKVLLFIVVLAGIIYASFQFVLMPLYKEYEDKKSEYSNMLSEEPVMRAMLLSEAAVKENYQKAVEDYYALMEVYPNPLHNMYIDETFTGMAVDNRFRVIELRMNLDASPYTKPWRGGEGNTDGAPEDSAAFFINETMLQLGGTLESAKKILDQMEELEHIRVSRMSLDWKASSEYEITATLYCDVVMLEELA